MGEQIKAVAYFLYSFVPMVFKCDNEDNNSRKLRRKITVHNALIYVGLLMYWIVLF